MILNFAMNTLLFNLFHMLIYKCKLWRNKRKDYINEDKDADIPNTKSKTQFELEELY